MSRTPHGSIYLQEMLDVMLTTAAFDQEVEVLFIDDGVFQLKSAQDPAAAGLKDPCLVFQALKIYQIDRFFAERESIQLRGLTVDQLQLPCQLVPRENIERLMTSYDFIYNS